MQPVQLVEPYKKVEDGRVREVSVPPLAPRVTAGSLADIPFTNAAEAPEEPVLSRKARDGTWQDMTARELAAEILAMAKGLIALGLRPGDRLAIMARTTYEWTLTDFAAWAAGLVTVPVYPTSSALQARHILQDSQARACFVEDVEQTRMLSAERGNLPGLEHLWQFSSGAVGHVVDAGRELPDELVAERRAQLGPWSIATFIYTSGTTGPPKGCVLTHGNFFAEVDNAVELLYPVFRGEQSEPASTLLFLPLSHVFGRMVAIGCLRARVRLGHAPSLKTEDLLPDLASFAPTFLLGIPYVLEKIYNTGRATAERMGRASSGSTAGRGSRSGTGRPSRPGSTDSAAAQGSGCGPRADSTTP